MTAISLRYAMNREERYEACAARRGGLAADGSAHGGLPLRVRVAPDTQRLESSGGRSRSSGRGRPSGAAQLATKLCALERQ